MKILKALSSLLVLCLLLTGCATPRDNSETASGQWEYSGPGYIRSIDWYHRSFLFESSQGNYTKSFYPVCMNAAFPVWENEHTAFSYRWHRENSYDNGCYQITAVIHLPEGK